MICALLGAFALTSCEKEYGPNQLDADVTGFIEEKYSGARILEAERQHGLLKVDIFHDNKEKEVVFDSKSDWVRTEWDVEYFQLPQPVLDAIKVCEYAAFAVDDADFVEEPARTYYRIEFEKGVKERRLSFSPEGDLL